MSFKKILIIRFSSIGDIVLTTPILRCIKNQSNISIHYLTKDKYVDLVKDNPHLDKIYSIKKHTKEILSDLYSENYCAIIDLQKNIRSIMLKWQLKKPYRSFNKRNFKKWILIYMGIDLLKKQHVVDRYFSALKSFNIYNDEEGLNYFISPQLDKNSFPIKIDFKKHFIAWVIGGTYKQKKFSREHIIQICQKVSMPVLLLGGNSELDVGEEIVRKTKKNNIYNLCGSLSIDQSAYILKNCFLVLTNDTGLMHIASAFKKRIISFWGCTKPSLGMSPYKSHSKSIQLISNSSTLPCSKLGNRCRFHSEGCVNNISIDEVLVAINKQEI